MTIDEARLREVLGHPDLDWLVSRARQRLRTGATLDSTVVLTAPTDAQRSAVARIIGELSAGSTLRVDLRTIETILRDAGICPSLRDGIEALKGPLEPLRAAQMAEWEAVENEAIDFLPQLGKWFTSPSGRQLLRRASGGDPERGRALVDALRRIADALPGRGCTLQELAVRVTGSSHGLDLDTPLGALALRVAAPDARGEDLDPRDVWAGVGVLMDELSAPLLVLNLPASAEGPTDRALRIHAEAGEPYRLSVRQLLRTAPTIASDTVYVCENPAVVAAAANALGPRCAPLVCVEGQPKTAAHLLLKRLRDQTRLRYHGDFDWPGLGIANRLIAEHGVEPWRFSTQDYRNAPAGAPLSGLPVTASWDPELSAAMRERGTVLHEEQVIASLLDDLGRPRHSQTIF